MTNPIIFTRTRTCSHSVIWAGWVLPTLNECPGGGQVQDEEVARAHTTKGRLGQEGQRSTRSRGTDSGGNRGTSM
jgi:hypothetical protein